LIFDFDGTLADTMPLHWQAWQNVMAQHRFHFTEERFYALGGVPSRDIVRSLGVEQGLDLDHLAVARDKEHAYLQLLPRVRPIREMIALVEANHGVRPMAVASGGTRRVIGTVLDHLGIRHFFRAVVTSEDVVRQKPAPDIFLEAARLIQIPADACRAFEDTDLGMQAIRSAGMDAVDVRKALPLVRAAAAGSH
jgi:beta-phosphoglucomutase family hydrolase